MLGLQTSNAKAAAKTVATATPLESRREAETPPYLSSSIHSQSQQHQVSTQPWRVLGHRESDTNRRKRSRTPEPTNDIFEAPLPTPPLMTQPDEECEEGELKETEADADEHNEHINHGEDYDS